MAAAHQQPNEVDEVIKRVLAIGNVTRYVIYTKDGIVIRYHGWPSADGDDGYTKCVQLAGTVANLVNHSSTGCQDLLKAHAPNNEVECLRLKTKEYEMIIAPGGSFTMVAIQENTKPSMEVSAQN